MEQEDSFAWILEQLVTPEWSKADHIMKVLYDHFPERMRNVDCTTLQSKTGEVGVMWDGLPNFQESCGDKTALFFIWLIENGASSALVDCLWLQQEFPVHAALAAASAFRCKAESSVGMMHPENFGRTCEEEANRYEQFAIQLLRENTGDLMAFIFRKSSVWCHRDILDMAHTLDCKTFVMEPQYQHAVNLLWHTPGPLEKYYWPKILEKKREDVNNIVGQQLAVIAFEMICHLIDPDQTSEEFWSIPKIKAVTHNLSRLFFIFCYSWYVLYSDYTGIPHIFFRLLLFAYGVSYGCVEILQMHEKDWNISEYLKSWVNMVDVLQITLIMVALTIEVTLVPIGVMTNIDAGYIHAINLLPCYCRLLQMFELSEYFGTLFVTFFDMYKDTLNFMVLLGIVGLGFSCALTPMVWTHPQTRWEQGVLWAFWGILGPHDDDKEQIGKGVADSWFGFLMPAVRFSLYLTLNVLLVNLLIAQMNDTFTSNKEECKRIWAYHYSEVVLEYASSEAHSLPPPLDLYKSVKQIYNIICVKDKPEETAGSQGDGWSPPPKATRQERRALMTLQQKVVSDDKETKTSDKEYQDKAEEARSQMENKIRLVANQMEKFGNQFENIAQSSALQQEISKLKLENSNLIEENKKLKVWYSLLAGRASKLMEFVDTYRRKDLLPSAEIPDMPEIHDVATPRNGRSHVSNSE